MKTGKLFLTAVLSTVILFTACKKDDPAPETTTLQKLQAKWNYEKITDHTFMFGMSFRDTTIATPGDYIDFRTDNKAYSKIDGNMDTLSYSLFNNSKVIIGDAPDRDTLDIQTLTNNQLKLYLKEVDGADYYEATLHFNK